MFSKIIRPKWTIFWCFPLIAVLVHDFFVFMNGSGGFYFSETGYLIQHYTPYEQQIIRLIDHPYWTSFLKLVFNAKAVLVALIWALPGTLWVNRPPRSDYGPKGRTFRKRHR